MSLQVTLILKSNTWRMNQQLDVDASMEVSESGLKELVLRWFMETQASLILSNGNFPDWFQGFAGRQDTEDLLRDKDLGSFLIRLSDKAIGFILSYKGYDRCRHFVITQNQNGHFVIAGDYQTYASLTELIEHYKASPIQPFGEYLTSSCHQCNTGVLYDVVTYNTTETPGSNVQALRTLWDQKAERCPDQRAQQQSDSPASPPLALPSKSKNRKLTGAMSVDMMSHTQAVPPVPRRGIPLGLFIKGSLPSVPSQQVANQSEVNRSHRPRGNTKSVLVSNWDLFSSGEPSRSGEIVHNFPECAQVEGRGRSLHRQSNNMEEEEEQSDEEENSNHQLWSASCTSSPAFPLRRVTCHTYSLHQPRQVSFRTEQEVDTMEVSQSNPLYQTSMGTSSKQEGEAYANVLRRPSPVGLPDDTYEQIPLENIQGNMYESFEAVKTRKLKLTPGKNNMKWKRLLPNHKKK